MIESIVNLLRISYSGPSNQDIKRATQILQSFVPQQGFLPALMQISVNEQIDSSTTCAALSLIKNNARSYWQLQKNEQGISLDPIDKEYLINNILALNVTLSDNYKYAKIIKDIISFISKNFQKDLLSQLLGLLERGEELRTCLNFMLGIASYYRYTMLDNDVLADVKFIQAAIPRLTEVVMKGEQALNQIRQNMQGLTRQEAALEFSKSNALFNEIVYLSIKFMVRTLKFINNSELRNLSMTWAKVCLNQLKVYNQRFMNEIAESEDLSNRKGSEIFNYFHGRKWAIKYLDRFIQNILVYKKQDRKINQSTRLFYQQNWSSIAHVLQTIFANPSSYKLRCFQITLLETVFRIKPKYMFQWADHYQFQVLPHFIKYQQYDYSLARQNPVEFLAEEQAYIDDDNLKMKAANLWLNIAFQITIGLNSTKHSSRIEKSFQFITACISHTDHSIQLTGLYLICKLLKMSKDVTLWSGLKQQLNLLCNFTVNTLVKSNDYLIIVKLLSCYKEIATYLHSQTHQIFCNFIITMLVHEQQEVNRKNSLINIMAIIGIGYFQKATLQSLNQPQLRYCLSQYLQFISNHDLQDIMVSFKSFLFRIHGRLHPYALQIIDKMHSKLALLQQQETEEEINQKNSVFKKINKDGMCPQAIESLILMCNFIQDGEFEIKQALQNELIYLLEKYFSSHHYYDSPIVQLFDGIIDFYVYFLQKLLDTEHLFSRKLLFFYQVVVFKVAGLSVQQFKQIRMLNLSQDQKIILQHCMERQQYSFQEYFRVLRLYLKVIDVKSTLKPIRQIAKNVFLSNKLEQLFFLVFSFYQKGNQDAFYSQMAPKGQILSIILLIELIEEYFEILPPLVYQYIFAIIKKNTKILSRKIIIRYHLQLFSMWIWAFDKHYFALQNQSPQKQIDSQIMIYLSKISQINQELLYEEYKRFVLALSFLLKISLTNQRLAIYFEAIVDLLFNFMRNKLIYEGIITDQNKKPMVFDKIKKKNIKSRESNVQKQQYNNVNQDRDEPNYIFQLQPTELSFDVDGDLEEDLQFLADPQSLYNANYQTKLDIINENVEFFKSLKQVQLNYADIYYEYIQVKKRKELNQIIESLQQQNSQWISSFQKQE